MAIFEKKFERKITLDDTQSLSCVIETAQKVNGHTVSDNLAFFLQIFVFHFIALLFSFSFVKN